MRYTNDSKFLSALALFQEHYIEFIKEMFI